MTPSVRICPKLEAHADFGPGSDDRHVPPAADVDELVVTHGFGLTFVLRASVAEDTRGPVWTAVTIHGSEFMRVRGLRPPANRFLTERANGHGCHVAREGYHHHAGSHVLVGGWPLQRLTLVLQSVSDRLIAAQDLWRSSVRAVDGEIS